MLKTMRETRFSDEDDPMSGGDSLKLYRELLDQQWASKLSNGRGLGFADMLVKHLERQAGIPMEGDAPAADVAQPVSTAPTASGAAAPRSSGPSAALPAFAAPASPTSPASADRKARFLESLRPHAEAASAATGVPARFILAQAALESGWGEREIRDAEGQSSFNLFGIKAGRGWTGDAMAVTTTEYRQGMPMKMTQRFRAYPDYGAAFTDHANLLRSRFGEALAAGDDAEAFARGLAEGGYATDPAYAGKLKAVVASVAMAGL
jgi:flagellar protein FlgJ